MQELKMWFSLITAALALPGLSVGVVLLVSSVQSCLP